MPDLNIPKDAAVAALCNDLYKMREGLAAMGLHAHILDRARDKLKELAAEVERFKSDRTYVLGHNDGWDAAMATGIPGQESDDDEPCGECHLQPGETCDICGRTKGGDDA